jgi:hypothetical protein
MNSRPHYCAAAPQMVCAGLFPIPVEFQRCLHGAMGMLAATLLLVCLGTWEGFVHAIVWVWRGEKWLTHMLPTLALVY